MSVPSNDLLTLLARTPATVRTLLEDLPEELLHASVGEDTSTPFIVLGHLIQGEVDDWIPRAHWILAQGREQPPETVGRLEHIDCTQGHSLDELLTQFGRLREKSLAALGGMLERGGDLDAGGIHPELGEVTFGELLAIWAVHDLTHISQIVRLVAGKFDEDVGPWREYLPILEPRI